ncbi:hypothetical protein J5N97_021920 [Dioscorea zingiberensis]|uniref:Dirigent protein n=1 Tax=Dioscorea zingiberensis TaxID=325984 RepID=A0A9D5CA02_9LILI|nr:hypothetical protein J5N97_021901 [Dioscorea zingiberensis]KAJ0969043.1 hypothetical protein J5N97_021920 [Dioscorea zingiberensis]
MDTNHQHLLLLLFLLFPLNFVSQSHAHDHEYHFIGKEKVTTLHFYAQETFKGDHPSVIVVAGPKDNNTSNQTRPFGTVYVIDDPLTEGIDPNSKVVGRAQGLSASAGQDQVQLLLLVASFTSGEFNGSSLSVLSRNPILETERELAVVGGQGKFRLARGGAHPTAVLVAKPNGTTIVDGNPTPFGSVFAIDDPITDGPDLDSQVIGNAQGLYVSSDQNKLSLVLFVDFGFTTGEFNGSSISVFSRNPVLEVDRELAVVGGRGKFRLARGFANLRTYSLNGTNGDAIIEYNVTVFHYE